MHPSKDIHTYQLDNELVLLAESTGRLYHANATAALIWQGMGAGLKREDIETLMAEALQVEKKTIAADLSKLLREWQTNGLLDDALPPHSTPRKVSGSANTYAQPLPPASATPIDTGYRLLDSRVMLRLPGEEEAALVHPFLAHLQVPELTDRNMKLEIRKSTHHYVLLHDGKPIDWCDDIQTIAPMVHGNMQPLCYEQAQCLTGLHAASVAIDHHCILMPALSGSGKSTLTSALVGSGFVYCSDDLVLLTDEPVRMRPAPTAIGLKKGSWPILEPYHPELASLTTHCRHDDKLTRYLPPPADNRIKDPQTRLKASHIIFPGYRKGFNATIRPISQAEGLCRITEAGYDIPGGLTASRVEQMINWITDIPCYEFYYSNLQEAVDALKQFLNES